MRLRGLLVPWLAVAAVLSACGPVHGGGVDQAPPSARPAPTELPSQAPALPLIAVLDHPFGAAPNSLRVLRPAGGGEVARIALDPDAEAVTTSGSLVLVAVGGKVRAYAADGSTVATVSLGGAADALVRGLAGDVTATRWLWSEVAQAGDTATSTVYAAGPSAAPAVVLSSSASGRALQPLAWTAGGPVLSDEPLGIGGYVLFRRTFGATEALDLAARTVRPLTDAACAFSDMAADGSVACILNGREAANTGGAVTLRVTRPGRPPLTLALPATVAQAGAALFSPDASTLTLATSPALGEGGEQISMELVDLASGAHHAFGAAGLMPVAWLPDGRLVAVRLPGVAGGDAGTYVLDGGSGEATLISTGSTVAGVLR